MMMRQYQELTSLWIPSTTTTISDSVIGHDHVAPATMASATNFGIPLTGSMATGFAFMKGW
jgi:hypothetical protein